MARKALKVEGKTNEEVKNALYDARISVIYARQAVQFLEGAFPVREYKSLIMHLNKSEEIVTRRIDVVTNALTAETDRAVKEKTEKAIKTAMENPEKAAALKELLNL